ncbi:MAG: hypothetical protein NWP83_10630, partial [Spirosomaceae bacterium]|nr:hypothetical protein [Spirosomataceae bacterium]
TLDDLPIPLFKTVNVIIGSVLKFTKKVNGERIYLAVKGGFDLEKWLGSVSYNQAVKLPNLKIEKGLSVKLKNEGQVEKTVWLGRQPLLRAGRPPLRSGFRFLPAPEYHHLTEESRKLLQNSPFQITKDANRMGYRLAGVGLRTTEKVSLLSSAVTFGTMQLLPDGQIIVLMASHQTTGGYPRIGTIIGVDLPLLAQCGADQIIGFEPITTSEAEQLLLHRERYFRRLKTSVAFRFRNR